MLLLSMILFSHLSVLPAIFLSENYATKGGEFSLRLGKSKHLSFSTSSTVFSFRFVKDIIPDPFMLYIQKICRLPRKQLLKLHGDSSRIPRRFSENHDIPKTSLLFQQPPNGWYLNPKDLLEGSRFVARDHPTGFQVEISISKDLLIQRFFGHRMAGASTSTSGQLFDSPIDKVLIYLRVPSRIPHHHESAPKNCESRCSKLLCQLFGVCISPSTNLHPSHPLKPTLTTIGHSIFMFS